jgi:Domain of unknown function (DUF4337)
MEEPEVPTEHLHEAINEKAEEAKEEKRWTLYVAISTALMAVFAALSSLFAGHHSNEALIEQIKASDQWSYYQAKGIKADILRFGSDSVKNSEKLSKYDHDQEVIRRVAEGHQEEAEKHLQKHNTLSKAVTFFQIAIAISAISVITGRRILWYVSLLLAATGLVFFVINLLAG